MAQAVHAARGGCVMASKRPLRQATVLERLTAIETTLDGLPDAMANAIKAALAEYASKHEHENLVQRVAALEAIRHAAAGGIKVFGAFERYALVAFPYVAGLGWYLLQGRGH